MRKPTKLRLIAGCILALVGGLGTLVTTPYAFILAMMSGFSENTSGLIAICIAVPLICVLCAVTGVCIAIKSLKE